MLTTIIEPCRSLIRVWLRVCARDRVFEVTAVNLVVHGKVLYMSKK